MAVCIDCPTLCRQLLLGLAEWLCDNRETDERARRIVEGMHLFLLPTMNPDGFERRWRGNYRQVQLLHTNAVLQITCSLPLCLNY